MTQQWPMPGNDRLNAEIARYTARGYSVESNTPTMATLVRPRRVNHVIHAILSVLTLGDLAVRVAVGGPHRQA